MIQVRRLIQTSNLISRTQFIFMIDVQWSTMLTSENKLHNSNLCIRFHITVEIRMWATRS